MAKKQTIKYHLMKDESPILSFFLTPSKDGVIFGLIIPEHDIHLTILYNEEKKLLQPHITDKTVIKGRRQQPLGRYTDVQHIIEEIIYRIQSWTKTYHFNQRGWILKPQIKSQIQKLIEPKEFSSNEFHQPLYTELELPDFSDEACWTRVRLKDMIGNPELIILEGKRIIHFALILDEKRMISVSEQQFEEFVEYLFEVTGFNDYLKYIQRKVPKKKIVTNFK